MKTSLLSLSLVTLATATALAQPAEPQPVPAPQPAPVQPAAAVPAAPVATAAYTAPQPQAQPFDAQLVSGSGWTRPVGARLLHGIRIGAMTVMNYEKLNREGPNGEMTSLQDEFGLKSDVMMLLGYEAMYRIVGHSWLNVVLVGNVSVAGLEQSKFIPAASGLIGAEINQSFQLGIGVNVLPDSQAPTHMIAAAGWTPKVGAIYTPIHFFFVPDPDKNHRMGATVGVTW
jgi:hypothetical protein